MLKFLSDKFEFEAKFLFTWTNQYTDALKYFLWIEANNILHILTYVSALCSLKSNTKEKNNSWWLEFKNLPNFYQETKTWILIEKQIVRKVKCNSLKEPRSFQSIIYLKHWILLFYLFFFFFWFLLNLEHSVYLCISFPNNPNSSVRNI